MRALHWLLLFALAAAPAAALGAEAAAPQERPKAAPKPEVQLPDTSDAAKGLDLAPFRLDAVYEADFSKPLKFIREDDLFSDGKRIRKPEGVDWVLEGASQAWVEKGRLHLKNDPDHLVFWNLREFPADFLLEFGVSPADSNCGLAIVFFAARGLKGESIFDLGQPYRGGLFVKYTNGPLNSYHTSYWATSEEGRPRGTAHIRKNTGFHMVAMGKDFVAGQGPGPHRVRILKVGGKMQVEANGRISVAWEDDGKAFGPILKEGLIGLRQMAYSKECTYTHFKVWEVKPK